MFSSCALLGLATFAPPPDTFPAARPLALTWLVDADRDEGLFRLSPYAPTFILPARYSTDPNGAPRSELPAFTVDEPLDYQPVETVVQLSLKTKVAAGLLGGRGALYLAYTQRGYWQVYNDALSRPFRENSYAPELLFNAALDTRVLGWRLRAAGLSLAHQSNGLSAPRSRSWNRLIAHVGLERGRWSVLARPWLRLPGIVEQNPGIVEYVGRGGIAVTYADGATALTAALRHPFTPRHLDRGSLHVHVMRPVAGQLRGYLQATTGYGETLVDYNHAQTTVGLGVAFVDW